MIRRFPFLLLALSVPFLPGCGTTAGGDSGEALVSTKVDFVPRFNLEKAIIDVFRGSGFEYTQRTASGFTFQQSGGGRMKAQFGDWYADGVEGKVEVRLESPGYRRHDVQASIYRLAGGAAVGPAGSWVPVREGRAGLKDLLKKVKKLAEVM